MRAFRITETGNFMTKLLSGRSFDSFLLEEASLSMQVTWHLDGRINRNFYSSEEWEDETTHPYPLIAWEAVRGHLRELIRGKKAPLQDEGYPQLAESVGAMALNIRYDGSEVTLVTGISLKSFSLDKNADRIWDSMMERFLASREIGFEAMT